MSEGKDRKDEKVPMDTTSDEGRKRASPARDEPQAPAKVARTDANSSPSAAAAAQVAAAPATATAHAPAPAANASAAKELVMRYYSQLTQGCGRASCDNRNCASSPGSLNRVGWLINDLRVFRICGSDSQRCVDSRAATRS